MLSFVFFKAIAVVSSKFFATWKLISFFEKFVVLFGTNKTFCVLRKQIKSDSNNGKTLENKTSLFIQNSADLLWLLAVYFCSVSRIFLQISLT